MLIPAFKLQLNNPILKGLADVGKYDGEHPSLTCATTAGKIFFHTPHDKSGQNEVKFLNINRKICALRCGRLATKHQRDLLFVGAQTTLLAYDVQDNCDLFFKDTPDGANAILVGRLGDLETPLALVGGNCSIQGYDHEGSEEFWTVTGDNVSAMAFCDVDEDGALELLVGSEDYEIRVFRNEEVISETTETEMIVALAPMRRTTFAYALANGTIGVYDKPGQRKWRVKSKNEACAIAGFDLDGDGMPEVISGWGNGKLEVRSDTTGELIYKDHMSSAVSAILTADYRADGHVELIVCADDGEVKAYLPVGEELTNTGGGLTDGNIEEDALRELYQRKQELEFELRQYGEVRRKNASGERQAGMVPADTRISTSFITSRQDGCVYVVLHTNNDTRLKAAAIFAERLFDGESFVVHEKEPVAELRIPIRPPRDVAATLAIKALAGTARSGPSSAYHVFDLTFALPKFAMYVTMEGGAHVAPQAGVSFDVREKGPRVHVWLKASFNVEVPNAEHSFSVGLTSLRDGKALWLMLAEGGGKMQLLTEDMELAAEVLQDLCAFLQISDLESVAEFPSEMESFRGVLLRVDDYNAARVKMTAEMADTSQLAKTLVIKAEDARILEDINGMRRAYSELYSQNAALLGEYNKRANNHEQLLAALKDVNQMIQKAARLRVGAPKSRVVSACRAAIKANNIHALFKIIKTGAE
mmetsp:Transcript_21661/g.44275  ORF Transcript_21661/g.44275 Transcript_21661/m.44275 type:complete len:703 (+) Transcript_21661:114-2222(+)